MQTLSEFRKVWHPIVIEQAKDVASKIEADRNMGRFLLLEPRSRRAVDTLVHEYALTLSVAPESLADWELGYLLHLRLQQACELAQFLDHCGLGGSAMPAPDWIQFLAIDSWHEFTVHKWRYEFSRVYGEPRERK